jgi:hypothetical protein
MNARSVSGVVFLSIVARAAMAQGHESTVRPLSDQMVGIMFGIGIVAIAGAWVAIPLIFARFGKLDELIDLLRRGAVMRFVTVTYIVIVVVTLALIDRLDGDKVSTLLASIAGYVLGSATSARESSDDDAAARKHARGHAVTPADARPHPAPGAAASES